MPNANEINTKKHEMYMANTKNLRLGPNATYIPLTLGVWVFALGVTQIFGLVSGVTQIFAFLDTNMLVSLTQKLCHWGSRPKQGPYAKILHCRLYTKHEFINAKDVGNRDF